MAFIPEHTIVIYSDGACSGNPGPGGYAAIVLTPELEVTELGGAEAGTTNNRMEMMGVVKALEHIENRQEPVWVHTDSTYVIRGIQSWVHGWKRRGWQTQEGKDVANPDLWKRLYGLTYSRKANSKITWHYVRGHTGVPGNERCDEIAVGFSQGKRPALYRGPLQKYDVEIDLLPEPQPLPEMKPKTEKTAPYSYLSFVNGVLKRHQSWKDCEAATKGRPGAKFKKATSETDEIAIVKSWGLDPARLKGSQS